MKNITIAIIIMLVGLLGGYFIIQKNKPIKISPKKSKVVEISPKDEFSFVNQGEDLKGVAFGDIEYTEESNVPLRRSSSEAFDTPKESNLGVFAERESPDNSKQYSVGVTYKLNLDP